MAAAVLTAANFGASPVARAPMLFTSPLAQKAGSAPAKTAACRGRGMGGLDPWAIALIIIGALAAVGAGLFYGRRRARRAS